MNNKQQAVGDNCSSRLFPAPFPAKTYPNSNLLHANRTQPDTDTAS